MTVVKFKEIVFRVLVIFLEKAKYNIFSKYINIKIEMNLCSGKTVKLKICSPLRETVA